MPTPAPGPAARPSAAPALRRNLLAMFAAVVLLDVAGYVLKQRLAVDAWPANRRLYFTAAWMVATLAVILPFTVRMRAARSRARQARLDAARGR